MKKKTKPTNIEFSPIARRNLNGLMHFSGWIMKRVTERALALANKNRVAFLQGGSLNGVLQ